MTGTFGTLFAPVASTTLRETNSRPVAVLVCQPDGAGVMATASSPKHGVMPYRFAYSAR
jgi:hypothetical protein